MQLLKYLAHMGNSMMVASSLLIGTNGASNDYVNAIDLLAVDSGDVLSIYACTQINNYSIMDTLHAYNKILIRYVRDSTLHKEFLQITRNIITNDISRKFDPRHPVVKYIKGINGKMHLWNATHLVGCNINVITIKFFDNLPNITHLHLLSNLLHKTTDDEMDMTSSMLSSTTENILCMMQITGGDGNVVFDPTIIRQVASASNDFVKEVAKTTFYSLFP